MSIDHKRFEETFKFIWGIRDTLCTLDASLKLKQISQNVIFEEYFMFDKYFRRTKVVWYRSGNISQIIICFQGHLKLDSFFFFFKETTLFILIIKKYSV